jgi:hypothetical protein
MTQCIRYAVCHEKVVMPFKVGPPELIALVLGSVVPPSPRRPARLGVKDREG